MNTITMANALKAVFGAQTLTTASYFPACAQDGTPSGVISAANLASVLGGISPFSVLKYYFATLSAGGTYSIPDWNKGVLTLIYTSSHSGDTAHLYIGNTPLHTGTNLKVTFSDGTITSTDTIGQSLKIIILNPSI